jgi:hypothetical protein
MITRAYFIDDIFVRSTGVQHLESTKFRYQFGYIITKKITRISVYGLQKIQKKKRKKKNAFGLLVCRQHVRPSLGSPCRQQA